ncbi:hypothetical protein Bbelb_446350, partial [Branchiostoma belcheri]
FRDVSHVGSVCTPFPLTYLYRAVCALTPGRHFPLKSLIVEGCVPPRDLQTKRRQRCTNRTFRSRIFAEKENPRVTPSTCLLRCRYLLGTVEVRPHTTPPDTSQVQLPCPGSSRRHVITAGTGSSQVQGLTRAFGKAKVEIVRTYVRTGSLRSRPRVTRVWQQKKACSPHVF